MTSLLRTLNIYIEILLKTASLCFQCIIWVILKIYSSLYLRLIWVFHTVRFYRQTSRRFEMFISTIFYECSYFFGQLTISFLTANCRHKTLVKYYKSWNDPLSDSLSNNKAKIFKKHNNAIRNELADKMISFVLECLWLD